MNQRAIQRLQRNLRRLSWVIALGAVAYLAWRFETLTLPAGGCSPLFRFQAGQTLLTDRHPSTLAIGDAVLYRASGQVLLGSIEELRGAGRQPISPLASNPWPHSLWLVTDAPDCPGADSRELGWIPVEDLAARVLLVWPW